MVGIIDVVDGWAYFTFKRQWGYIDTRYLAELGKVAQCNLGDANTPLRYTTPLQYGRGLKP